MQITAFKRAQYLLQDVMMACNNYPLENVNRNKRPKIHFL